MSQPVLRLHLKKRKEMLEKILSSIARIRSRVPARVPLLNAQIPRKMHGNPLPDLRIHADRGGGGLWDIPFEILFLVSAGFILRSTGGGVRVRAQRELGLESAESAI